MIKILNKKMNNKGFTLIELIVVIAIIGILVLLAAPKFMGYVADAKEAQMKNDIKVVEYSLAMNMVKNDDQMPIDSWMIDYSEVDAACVNSAIYGVEGMLDWTLGECPAFMDYYEITESEVVKNNRTTLDGRFIANNIGEVFYIKPYTAEEPVYTTITPDRWYVTMSGIGETITMTATVNPDLPIMWESMDETIAVVNNGVITSVGYGITNIVMRTADGTGDIGIPVYVINPISYSGTVTDVNRILKTITIDTGSGTEVFNCTGDTIILDVDANWISLRDIEDGSFVIVTVDQNSSFVAIIEVQP